MGGVGHDETPPPLGLGAICPKVAYLTAKVPFKALKAPDHLKTEHHTNTQSTEYCSYPAIRYMVAQHQNTSTAIVTYLTLVHPACTYPSLPYPKLPLSYLKPSKPSPATTPPNNYWYRGSSSRRQVRPDQIPPSPCFSSRMISRGAATNIPRPQSAWRAWTHSLLSFLVLFSSHFHLYIIRTIFPKHTGSGLHHRCSCPSNSKWIPILHAHLPLALGKGATPLLGNCSFH